MGETHFPFSQGVGYFTFGTEYFYKTKPRKENYFTDFIFKRGSDFSFTCKYEQEPGYPVNLKLYTISFVFKNAGNEYTITTTKASDGLSFTGTYTGDTGSWVSYELSSVTITYTLGTEVFYSGPLRVNVIN
jgi:hypothetical protein